MKKSFWLLLFLAASLWSFGQKNLTLLSNYIFPGTTCAGVWHYNSTDHEYALVGTGWGMTILDITDPSSPQHIFDVPDTPGLWREIKVWDHYAYMSNEGQHGHGGGGITIVDLSSLPGAPLYKKYTGDGPITDSIFNGHTVQAVDTFLYINGSNYSKQGTIICSLADPWNPHFVGIYEGAYVHDCFVRGNTLVTSEIYAGQFTIIDITDKSAPNPIRSNPTPGQFNHNTWMSDNSNYLYTTDEKPNAPLGAYDISNKNNIKQQDIYRTNKNPVGEVHNVRVFNDFLVNACYGDSAHTGSQVTIVDAARPANLIEVGDYQLCSAAKGFMISWDVDPYLPSGNLIATEGLHGLFVFAPTYRRACYLEGAITDCQTNFPLNNAKIEILVPPADTLVLASEYSMFTGAYRTGLADSGIYDVRISPSLSDSAYAAKVFTGIVLKNGVLTNLSAALCKKTAGMDESILASDAYIYPDPATDKIMIHFPAAAAGKTTIAITNVLGQAASAPLDMNNTGLNLPVDISNLSPGIYFLCLKTGNYSAVKRFIKE